MILIMKTNSINQIYIYWNVHDINIEVHGEKNQILAKQINLLSST
jgi:hypothetical protein